MQLSLDTLRTLVRGAVEVRECDGWVQFLRFTEEQAALYRTEAASTDFYNKTFATAGVRIAMHTDFATVSFSWRVKTASARKGAWFDVYEDGELTAHFGTPDEGVREGRAELALRGGLHGVEIYFPWSCMTEISEFTLSGGSTLLPLKRNGSLLCFGDSITHGYDTEFPSLSYVERLGRALSVDVVNKGIGGEHFRPNLARLPEPSLPNGILVAYGTNDWNFHTKAVLTAECEGFLQGLQTQYPGIPVFVVSPIWRTDCQKETPYQAPLQAVHGAMAEICSRFANVQLICGWDMMPHEKELIFDFVHPNTKGFGAYAERLAQAILKKF